MPPRYSVPGPVPREALEYFRAKGIKVGFDYTDIWKEEHSAAFTVAKIVEEDVLESVRELVERALEGGMTFEQFKKEIIPMLDRSGWSNYNQNIPEKHRLRTIYATNMRVARSAGQWQRVQRTKVTLPYLVYELGPSARHREQHVSWAGTTLPVDHPWWDDHYTPNGWGCRCNIRQAGEAEIERSGGETEAPPSYDVPWENPKTGKVELVPVGIDPGWNYNPGVDRMRGLIQ